MLTLNLIVATLLGSIVAVVADPAPSTSSLSRSASMTSTRSSITTSPSASLQPTITYSRTISASTTTYKYMDDLDDSDDDSDDDDSDAEVDVKAVATFEAAWHGFRLIYSPVPGKHGQLTMTADCETMRAGVVVTGIDEVRAAFATEHCLYNVTAATSTVILTKETQYQTLQFIQHANESLPMPKDARLPYKYGNTTTSAWVFADARVKSAGMSVHATGMLSSMGAMAGLVGVVGTMLAFGLAA